MTKLISGRVAKVDSANVSAERYQFIGLSETEPDLGLPAVSGYVLSSDLSGNRIWVDAASASGSPYFANTSAIANVALTANIANTVLTLSNFTTANLVEGINLYYTNARVLSFITPYLTTANVLESDSNLYYTNARVYAAIEGNLATKANVADLTTSNVSEGSNLYYTNARVISAVLPYLTTSNVVEGSNLYYTNTRVYSNVIATLAGNITIGNATIGNVSVAGSTTFGAGTGGSLTGANLLSASYIQTGNLLATSGNILITGNIIPSIDSTFNFGSLDKQWKDFYLSAESLYVGGQKISGNAQTGLTLVSLTASNITTGNLVVANSLIGNVTGTVSSLSNFSTSNLAEGTNQYFTNARVTANLEQQSVNVFVDVDTTGITTNGILIWNGTSFVAGTIDTGATANIALFANTAGTANVALTANIANTVLSLSNLTTSNLAEGANLYFTNARAVAAFTAGQNIIIEANGRISANVNLEIANLNSTISNLTTNSITEGNNNLYYTNGRVISAVTPLLTTANVIESDSNLYYTNARTRSALSGGTGVSYDNGTGVISIGQNVASTANVTFFNLSVTNNLTVYGGVTTYGANNLSVSDNMIYLNSNSTVSNPDIGFAFNYNDGVYHHGGFFRDASDNGTFKVFENYLPEPDANIFIDTADASFRLANIAATTFFGNVSGTAGSLSNFTTANLAEGTNLYYTNARVNSYIQGNLASKANITDLTTSNVVEGTNLYYTNARVNSYIQDNLATKANVTDLTTANVSELTNLYYTNSRVSSNVILLLPTLAGQNIIIEANGRISANVDTSNINVLQANVVALAAQVISLANQTTSNIAEGSNLYYTNARVRTAFTAGKGIRIFADGTIKSVAAGGEYNQSVDGGVAYMVSNVTAGVTFTGATSNDRFILRSMQVTNISNNVAYISSNVLYADGNTGYLGNLITVPRGGFVEFMGRTQIFQPNDSIYFKGFDNNYTPTSNILSAYLTYESVASDISYVGLGRTMANANANVVLVTADVSDFILESIKFVNLKTIDAPVTLYLANATTAVPKAYLAFNMIVPGTSSLEILQSAKLLKFGDALYARYANSSNADSIAVFTSYRKADATSLSSTTPSVSSTDTASIVFNTTISEGTTLYYTIE